MVRVYSQACSVHQSACYAPWMGAAWLGVHEGGGWGSVLWLGLSTLPCTALQLCLGFHAVVTLKTSGVH